MLARLAGGPDGYTRPAELRADLAATRTRPPETTTTLRALHLAISFCFVTVGFAMMLAWGRNGAVIRAADLDRAMVRGQALRDVLRDDALAGPLRAELPPDDPLCAAPEEQGSRLDERRARDGQELDALFASLGWVGFVKEAVPQFRLRRTLAGAEEPLEIRRRPGEPYAVEVVRPRVPKDEVVVLKRDDLEQVAARARGEIDGLPDRLRTGLVVILTLLSLVPLLLVASALVFRGGLSLRLGGLDLVRSDGRDAGRLRCAWRVVVVWVPVVAVLMPIVWIDLRRPDLLWLCPVLQGLAVLLLAVHAALALRFPRRSYPDWLAGTYVVPH
jgi:hypothetical protein